MNPLSREAPPWCVIRLRTCYERLVAAKLRRWEGEVFLPTCPLPDGSGRVREPGMPLFPGYVFARVPKENAEAMFFLPGVLDILRVRNAAVGIPDRAIQMLQRVVRSGAPYGPAASPIPGAPLRQVVSGPLQGLRGWMSENDGKHCRLVLSLRPLSLSYYVDLELDQLAPTGTPLLDPTGYGPAWRTA